MEPATKGEMVGEFAGNNSLEFFLPEKERSIDQETKQCKYVVLTKRDLKRKY